MAIYDDDPPRPVRLLYVAGMGRAGSTLVGAVLATMVGPSILLGESKRLWHACAQPGELCGCGDRFDQCSFWQPVLEDAFGGVDPVTAGAHVDLGRWFFSRRRLLTATRATGSRPPRDGAAAEYLSIVDRLIASIGRLHPGHTVVDTSKHPLYGAALTTLDDVDVGVVHLTRDPRAVANSHRRSRPRPEITWEDRFLPQANARRVAALTWERELEVAILRSRAGRSVRLRYEDFVDAPMERMADSLAGLGIDPDPSWGEGRPLPPGHMIAGNPWIRRQEPVRISADDAWRKELPRAAWVGLTVATAPVLVRDRLPRSLRS